ncbi:MAG: diguanylate cyclase [Thermoleophilia bacterium]
MSRTGDKRDSEIIGKKSSPYKRVYLLVPGAIFLVALIGHLSVPASHPRTLVLSLVQIVVHGIALIFSILAYRVSVRRQLRSFWFLLAVAQGLALLAQVWEVCYGIATGVTIQHPSVVDFMWAPVYLLSLAAVFLLVARSRAPRIVRITTILDSMAFGLIVTLFTWQLAFGNEAIVARDSIDIYAQTLYLLGEAMLLAAVAPLALNSFRSPPPRSIMYVGLSFLLCTIADVGCLLMAANMTEPTHTWINLIWLAGHLTIAVAAICYLDNHHSRTIKLRSIRSQLPTGLIRTLSLHLPYSVVPIVGVLLFVQFVILKGGSQEATLTIIIGSLFILILATTRQVVVMRDNLQLQSTISDHSKALETQKEQLSLLNQAAIRLSECLTSQEVVRTGIILAKEMLDFDASAILWRREKDRPRFQGSPQLSRTDRMELLRCVRETLDAPDFDSLEHISFDQLALRYLAPDLTGHFKTVVIAPTIVCTEGLGFLCLGSRAEVYEQVQEREKLVLALASQIGIALRNALQYDSAAYLAIRDSVTKLLNHRGATTMLKQELARADATQMPLTAVVMDIDKFKLINDTYGHGAGDEILYTVARTLGRTLRRIDVIARQGGDEFLTILPGTSAEEAINAIERVRAELRQTGFSPTPTGPVIPIIMSYGIAEYPLEGSSPTELLAAADAHLYRAKRSGGNRISSRLNKDPTDAYLNSVNAN